MCVLQVLLFIYFSYFLDKDYILSVAVPGSILNNAQGPELRTYLAGQIARTCAVFCVDEVVIYDETARITDKYVSLCFFFFIY